MPSDDRHIFVRAADTEPLIITISAQGVTDLANLTAAVLYLREHGAATNHVDGVSLAVHSSPDMQLAFDPVAAAVGGGDALGTAGKKYEGYVKVTWSDGDVTRHPNFPDFLRIQVLETFE